MTSPDNYFVVPGTKDPTLHGAHQSIIVACGFPLDQII